MKRREKLKKKVRKCKNTTTVNIPVTYKLALKSNESLIFPLMIRRYKLTSWRQVETAGQSRCTEPTVNGAGSIEYFNTSVPSDSCRWGQFLCFVMLTSQYSIKVIIIVQACHSTESACVEPRIRQARLHVQDVSCKLKGLCGVITHAQTGMT